jgi:osomolarity two-component system phosphorelay intermediate protein YPD1
MPDRHEEERVRACSRSRIRKYRADHSQQSEEGSVGLPDLGDSIDAVTFEQILEMDDDEDEREFSKSIVFGFFEQAEQTFEKMDKAL